MPKIIPVILAGGSGTRLWPLSRKDYPKQFQVLHGEKTMLQETILRVKSIENIEDPIIICNSEHRFLVAEQCQHININNPSIILEPLGKNTAPAITAAALYSVKKAQNPILLVLSADHVIKDVDAFHKAIEAAYIQAEENKLAIFGIVPNGPNTGYGYVKTSKEKVDGSYKVERFEEKPTIENAKLYFNQGNYLWNSGMFVFKAKLFLREVKEHSPLIKDAVTKAMNNAKNDLDFIRLDKEAFELSPNLSVDYAVLEKSHNVNVILLNADWNDVGSWSALYDIGEKDDNGNILKGDVIIRDTHNTYINSGHHMIATIGISNLIIVDTQDVIFIATREKSEDVKNIVNALEESNRNESNIHRKVYRPWGWYDSIEAGLNFQVKRLHVNPGSRLSLQMHYKRAEHWVVVRGEAYVINGEVELILKQGESTYIPIGTKHGLENRTLENLEIIEVQSGSYLGEDDIVRYEDIYGRI